jgi:hypothetical protein
MTSFGRRRIRGGGRGGRMQFSQDNEWRPGPSAGAAAEEVE